MKEHAVGPGQVRGVLVLSARVQVLQFAPQEAVPLWVGTFDKGNRDQLMLGRGDALGRLGLGRQKCAGGNSVDFNLCCNGREIWAIAPKGGAIMLQDLDEGLKIFQIVVY